MLHLPLLLLLSPGIFPQVDFKLRVPACRPVFLLFFKNNFPLNDKAILRAAAFLIRGKDFTTLTFQRAAAGVAFALSPCRDYSSALHLPITCQWISQTHSGAAIEYDNDEDTLSGATEK